jgi:hypothetical protein
VLSNDLWPTVCDGHLCFGGVDVVEPAGDAETPFFLYGERRLRAVHPGSSSPERPAPACRF